MLLIEKGILILSAVSLVREFISAPTSHQQIVYRLSNGGAG